MNIHHEQDTLKRNAELEKELVAKNHELEIEAALERVRSRTNAMLRSENLHDVITEVNDQLRLLGFRFDATGFLTDYSDKGYNMWIANFPTPLYVPAIDHKLFNLLKDVIKRGDNFFTFLLTTEEKNIHFKNIFENTIAKNSPDELKEYVFHAKGMATSCVVLKNINLSVSNFASVPYTDVENDILKRFAYVFEQSYTRFLDLQKAEAQARESQIQLALERVRARTMAMQKSDELMETAVVLFDQLNKLGENIERTIIGVMNEEEGVVDAWATRPDGSQMEKMQKFPIDEPILMQKVYTAWRQQKKSIVIDLRGEELESYFQFLKSRSSRLKRESFGERRVENFAFFSKGTLGVISADPKTPANVGLYERFAAVFEQTYTRFLDLQKAEAQARESQIQLALERVRARTMAMQKSDELPETSYLLFQQVKELGLTAVQNSIAIVNEETGFVELSTTVHGHHLPHTLNVPINDPYVMAKAIAAWKAKHKSLKVEIEGQELKDYNEHRNSFFETKVKFPEDQWIVNIIFFSKGWLSFSSGKNISDETFELLKRFAAVFEQTYIRFNDLKQAEEQARESQTQLALERVRAKTMAMQKPSEFVDVINIIGEQFVHLGFDIDWVNFGANGFAISEGIDIWNFAVIPGASPMSARVFIPYFDHPVFTTSAANINEFLNGGRDLIIVALDKQTKNTWLDHLFTKTVFKDVPEEYRAIQYAKSGYTTSNISIKDTWLSIGKFDAKTFTEEQHAILRRFANAFGQAYTRFLDLQKAEAQAREAQIEAGLERVRSRAMAMQSSEQLRELIGTVFTELTKLDIVLTRCLIMIYDPKSNDSVWWMANSEAPTQPIGLKVQYHEHPSYLAYVNAWKQKELKWTYTLEGNTKKEWDDFLFVETELSHLPDFVIAGMKAPDRVYLNASFNSFGNLTLATLEPLSDEHFDIMLRFAKVFDLTYTRFNDLKQAEAQAREARIETALERVRARTMAMQKSDELPETTFLLFQQLKDLGETAAQLSIGIIKEEEGYVELSATVHGNQMLQTYQVPADEPYIMNKVVKAWKEKQRSLTLQIEGQELKDYNNWRNSVLEKKINFPEDRWIVNIVFFSKGMLSFSSDRQIPKETLQLLERFAGVFDITYTRFLDLKKAEAQTREAQIELALERVRARTMAMHKSEELAETAQVLFQQLSELGGIPDRISIAITDEVNGVCNFWSTDQQGSHLDHSFSARLNERTTIAKTYQAWKEQKKSLVIDLHGDELNEWIQFAREEMGIAVKEDQIRDRRVHTVAFFSHGWILVTSHQPQSQETIQILERFASVFNLTYRRFLDLQKAEAQAREAQIETSLERIRSRTMGMQKSNELRDVAALLNKELISLGITQFASCGYVEIEEKNNRQLSWLTDPDGASVEAFYLPLTGEYIFNERYDAWKRKDIIFKQVVHAKELKKHLDFAYTGFGSQESENIGRNFFPDPTIFYNCNFSYGYLSLVTGVMLDQAEELLLVRFTRVFEQTYSRFLDLQKAEAQGREAQIEASLERVRSKTMAMHNSQDVGETVAVMFDELRKLDVETLRCGVGIMQENYQMELWTARSDATGKAEFIVGHIDMKLHPLLTGGYEAWKNKAEGFFYQLKDEDLKTYFDAINSHQAYPAKYDISSLPSLMFHYEFNFSEGCLFAFSIKQFSDESSQIFKRFTGVFGQTYRRYLDLLKAEANTREAQIEAGLERVRARTMAMHSSEDVSIATATMFTELEKLGIENFRGGITNIHSNRTQEVWSVNNLAEGKSVKAVGIFNMDTHPFWQHMYEEWVNKKDFVNTFLTGKEKEDYIKVLNATQGYLPQTIQEFPDVHFQVYAFDEGGVWTNSLKPHTEEEKQIMKRFASVFSLTFRRYQDLQKAEAQAREATIETALEKVRGKAMAMHNSNDLSSTASLVFTELRKLGIDPIRCGVGIIDKETNKAQLYSATASAEGDSLSLVGWVMLKGHPVLEKIYETWTKNEEYYPEMQGDELQSYYKFLLSGFSVPVPDWKEEKEYGHFLPFSVGCLYAWSDRRHNETEIKILKRFASIIDLTFRRYIELQKSEANAREAVKQAALDRVRAEIASMRTINDLDRITPLIWNELTILGIPFIRCGVFIMDDGQQLIHTFLSTPDGKAIAAFHLPYDTPGNLAHVVTNWKENKKYIDHWDETEFTKFADILVRGGALVSAEQYLKTIPKNGFYLHFLPFLQGMLYVGNTDQLKEEEIELIQHVADAFSTAYARYEDFNKLEYAKQQVEKTLTDLKQAQTQLVQSEKMASLGEMTAGIAHEIQNPLNFVNNFSEVSKELLDEMKTELETGNTEDAKDIADDVIQNLEKINHHGKRADAIVKSMLQHSRSSSGKKEPTDINALADEYLRLAYHGLRAKDKTFNAKFETGFDNNIGKVNIISQDIGRVLVNLINNAFYAVSERKKQESNGYEPTVEVLTKKTEDKIEIKVRDNGNGIPKKVLDKIFQPFFTTKPTGQGTGLGLSLAYDIITKGHGGELKVETKEGEGSEFIIQLPVN